MRVFWVTTPCSLMVGTKLHGVITQTVALGATYILKLDQKDPPTLRDVI
jgi:hypothetical protein